MALNMENEKGGDDIMRAVFGGSESELSSDDEAPRQKQSGKAKAVAYEPVHESSGSGSEDDYVQERPSSSKPKKRVQRKRGDGENGTRPQRKRKRAAPPPPPEEINIDDLPPELAKKARLNATLDAILKPKRGQRRSKKKKDDEILDSVADAEVARLREAMNTAADEDIRANSEKQAATAKLRLLPEAMETLRKASLAQSMIDNNLLDAVKRWLEPLPDRSLPALNIQRELFNTIRKMEFIDTAVLKESGLGKIVLFYTKCKRVTPDISRIADELVSTWSRPIIKRSASYRDKIIPTAASGDAGELRAGERLGAILARAKEADKNRVRKNAVAIPQRELGNYTVAPRSNAGISSRSNQSVDVDIERRRKNAERMRSLTRKVNMK